MNDTMAAHRKRIEQYIAKYVQPGDPPKVMYDIGVGCGREAWSLKELYPNMRVLGVEPHPGDVRRLVDEGYPGTLLNVAVLDYEGETCIKLGQVGSGHSHVALADMDRDDAKFIKVPCTTLDILDFGMGHPDNVLLWMDIEYTELLALKGGTELLKSRRCKWMSLEATGGEDETKKTEYLAQFGYHFVTRYNDQINHWDVIYRL